MNALLPVYVLDGRVQRADPALVGFAESLQVTLR